MFRISTISAGRQHFGFTTDVEGVHLYGSNRNGQCGRRRDPIENSGLTPRFYIFETAERFRSNCVKISCGFDHTLVLLENGQILAFGNGEDGQLGQVEFRINHQPALIHQDEDVKFVDIEAKGRILKKIPKIKKKSKINPRWSIVKFLRNISISNHIDDF